MRSRCQPRLRFFLLACLPVLSLTAEDIDLFTRDLDLSGLRLPSETAEAPPRENRRLFEAWETLPEALREMQPEPEAMYLLDLPAGPFLAVPNPVSLPGAYALLNRALDEGGLEPQAPLIVLMHADDNVSVGCRVTLTESKPLPLGADLSRMPGRRLLVTAIEAETARRTETALVTAAARLRRYAHEEGLSVQTRELYLLPIAPGRVLFGLLIDP